MPILELNGARIHYDIQGQGEETILFIHGLMLASESFEAQVAAFSDRYGILTYDLRGQGKSEKTVHGLDIDSLARDAADLIETLDAAPAHVVGFSMGTFVAMRVAARRPELVRSLCLIGPSADAEDPENLPRYQRLIRLVRLFGPRLFATRLLMILFGDTFLNDPEKSAARRRWRRVIETLPRFLHRAAAASAHRLSISDEVSRIIAPTLIVSGEEDRPISPARSRAVHEKIAGSRFISFGKTGHAVMIERPDAFNTELRSFLTTVAAVAA